MGLFTGLHSFLCEFHTVVGSPRVLEPRGQVGQWIPQERFQERRIKGIDAALEVEHQEHETMNQIKRSVTRMGWWDSESAAMARRRCHNCFAAIMSHSGDVSSAAGGCT
jgi:hypothetical protein